MANHKAKMVFAPDVWKMIEWFTYNFKTEIGALGRVKLKKGADGEKYFYIDKLFFPKQKVTGATVHFTADMWGDLLKEHGLDGLKDIAFYWHRHPGSSAHSGTDDVDTFETFMSIEANRKHFLFLQTAVGAQGWNEEARIDLRVPVRTTITHNDILVAVEQSEEQKALKAECEAIAERVIVKEPPRPVWTGKWKNNNTSKTVQVVGGKSPQSYDGYAKYEGIVKLPKVYKDLQSAIMFTYFGEVVGTESWNNDIIDGMATDSDEKLAMDFKHGSAVVTAGPIYAEMLENVLTGKKDGKLAEYVRNYKKDEKGAVTKFSLQPKKKMYQDLKDTLIRSYLVFCSSIHDTVISDTETIPNTEHLVAEKDITVNGTADIQYLLNELSDNGTFEWADDLNALVYDLEYNDIMGHISVSEKGDIMVANGNAICSMIKDIQGDAESYTIVEEAEETLEDVLEDDKWKYGEQDPNSKKAAQSKQLQKINSEANKK